MVSSAGSLDANILLRLILRDVPEQSDLALNLIQDKGLFYVADTAIIEVVFALERYYEIPRRDVAKLVSVVINHPKLVVNHELFEDSLSTYQQFSKLSFEDCCLPQYAKLAGALPLWTFDKKLASQIEYNCKLLA